MSSARSDLGGAERHIALVAPQLQHYGWQPTIYCISHRGTQSAEVERAGATVIGPPSELAPGQTRIGKAARLLVSGFRLLRLMLVARPQVVHFFLPLAYLMGAPLALLTRVPVLVMSRRSLNNYQQQYPHLRRIELWLHPRMDAILGNSKAVVEQLITTENCPPNKVHLIYNGIDIRKFDRAPNGNNEATETSANVSLIIVANLIPYKGHRDLIEALGMVKVRLPDKWALACVGRDDGIRGDLKSRARQLGIDEHVRFLGQRTDVETLLKQANIGLLCSHEEGFANAILEGMAAYLPMIVTDVGGNAEAVADGVTGLVVPPRNPAALGQAILALAQDPARRTQMGCAARQRVQEQFSLPECVRRYNELYQKLLDHDAPGKSRWSSQSANWPTLS